MALALVSLVSGQAVSKKIAMTGELTLTGQVYPIGGLKEKILAARRNKINTIILPADNEKDLRDVPENIKGKIQFFPVDSFSEVLQICLPKIYQNCQWDN